jgi:hypothetical protein
MHNSGESRREIVVSRASSFETARKTRASSG